MTQPAAPLDLQPAIARDGSTLALTADELETYRYVIGAEADAELAFPVMADTFERLASMAAAEAPKPAPPDPERERAARVEAAARAVLEAVATIGHDRLEGAAEPLLNPVLELGEALDFWNPEA
jgi:hypothetical protein